MQVHLNHTSFRMRDDTEAIKETDGAVSFLTDHNVPFSRYTSPTTKMGNVVFGEEKMIQWHESQSTVEVDCDSIDGLSVLAEKYDAVFKIDSHGVSVDFR